MSLALILAASLAVSNADDREFEKAIAELTREIERGTRDAATLDARGDAYLKLGKMTEAIADYDAALKLVPRNRPQHWRRGIALYYAGRFKDGVEQFEVHQTVNPADVENAVWHYLCNAKVVGPEKARAALIPIRGDRRVPMMTVHSLFAGTAKPEDVLKDAASGSPGPERLKDQMFFAHLYLGLYFEAAGDAKRSLEHIKKATGEFARSHYMGDVARVHLKLRSAKP